MLRVLGCIAGEHDLKLVLLAGLICVFATYTAFSVAARAPGRGAAGSRLRRLWPAAAALVVGCAIWTTHFVLELAFRPGLPIAFDPDLTALSVLVAIALSGAGIALRRFNGAAAGFVIGLAIAAMHYTGMAALRVPALLQWDMGYVAASVVVGVAFSTAAMHIACARDDVGSRIEASLLLALAILGLHAIGMAAVRILPDAAVAIPDQSVQPGLLAIAVSAVTVLIVGLVLFGSIVDQHLAQRSTREAAQLREHVAVLEATRIELESTTTQLRHALQGKAEFLAVMSHELRTPLNAIIGFSEVLKEQLFGPVENARYRAYHDDIHRSGKHLLELVNDLLDACTISGTRITLVETNIDIAALLADCLKQIAPLAERKTIALTLDTMPGLGNVFADPARLRQIVLNLLSNAIKFTPDGGTVGIAASVACDFLDIAISDSGIGMAPEDIAKALEMFRQIDNSLARKFDGFGLGLPIAKQLAERHGGSLAIRSAPGKGTVVTIRLPRSRMVVQELAA